ncbi:tripartite tricarboxylate transporter permease [Halobacteria archaeon AArc-curdl1]|uniref:Tripartite tricarboxylate transporter permease n=1 Tax=Natronosalvus hydrolyticus TaxID=2979988 RepID=A0AAP2Z8H2_9EURY|nr:tripartite tricarboxylate transporter permease [Halobacteria archaeon AArc-curdl1]
MVESFEILFLLQLGEGIGRGDLLDAIQVSLSLMSERWHYLLIGVIAGMILGIIPGLGGLVALTILLPFTFFLDQYQAFMLLSGAIGATTFSGSLTAILINTPGTSSNAATMIDGYPLTQQGRANEAIIASAISSAGGAIVGTILFLLLLPFISGFVLMFGPSEVFWLIAIALVIIPLSVSNKPLYGIMTAMLGGLLALVGTAPQTGEGRFTLGIDILLDGVDLMAMIIGMFAIAEVVRLMSLGKGSIVDSSKIQLQGSKLEGAKAVIKHRWTWLRGSMIGVLIGAIPGAGATVSAFLAYAQAIQFSKTPDKFGSGAIEGVIAAEAANDAKDGGQLFPTLGLGIPGTASMAVFLAGLLIQGIFPSPSLIVDETYLVLVIILSILASNITTSIIGVALVKYIAKLATTPVPVLFVLITTISLSAVLVTRGQPIDLVFAVAFAIFGLLLIAVNVSRVPFLIAFVLVGMAEESFLFAVALSGGDMSDALLSGTLNIILVIIFAVSFLFAVLPPTIRQKMRNRLMKA